MWTKEQSSCGKYLYFSPRLSVSTDNILWVRQEFTPCEGDPRWLTAGMLADAPRLVAVHYVEQARVPLRGGRCGVVWRAALISHDAWFPPLRLTPRLCRELAAAAGMPHPLHWVGQMIWLVPRHTRAQRRLLQVVGA